MLLFSSLLVSYSPVQVLTKSKISVSIFESINVKTCHLSFRREVFCGIFSYGLFMTARLLFIVGNTALQGINYGHYLGWG